MWSIKYSKPVLSLIVSELWWVEGKCISLCEVLKTVISDGFLENLHAKQAHI